MTTEQYERAKTIISDISEAKYNIKRLEEYLTLKEITICDMSNTLRQICISGPTLSHIIQAGIDFWEKRKTDSEKELSEL